MPSNSLVNPMTPERRAKLEAAGHTVATAEDFFGLDEIDRMIVDFRLRAASEVRRLRETQKITQRELAERIEVSQSRVPDIENGRKTSLDVILSAYIAVGGELSDLVQPDPNPTEGPGEHRLIKRQPSTLGRVLRPAGMVSRKAGLPARASKDAKLEVESG